MHRRHKTQPILNPAPPNNLLHLRCNVHHLIPLLGMESQILGMRFHRRHKAPFSTANGTECKKFIICPSSMPKDLHTVAHCWTELVSRRTELWSQLFCCHS